jgi:hypothetical protein
MLDLAGCNAPQMSRAPDLCRISTEQATRCKRTCSCCYALEFIFVRFVDKVSSRRAY